ncbi:NACHT domain-containing protein [Nostoc sp. DSM 114161]|jgi:adenylate kinase family enzyme|uniref:NACHT domain-containing protein n=1 Tax=Nostoc sp. DSM 114161 TaxID=3440143 RepID=UPI004045FCC1
MIDILGFGTIALKATLPTVVKEIIKKAQSQLNPTELEKAIKTGIKAAQDADSKKQKGLLSACDDKQIDTFLAKVVEYSGVQTELEKALKDRFPDIQNLIEAFKQVAQKQNIELNEPDLEPWLWTFSNTYFQELPVYGRYQAAKDNYLNQIIKDSEKIHFAGIKMKGQDWDIPEPLEKIFVIPDVINEEQKANRVSLNSKDMISANKLLNSSLSQQMVILGDPGSGKSTLMQYFAAKVAQQKFAELGLPEDLLPILIRIRDLANQPEINILTYLQDRIPRKYTLDIPEGFFDYWLKQGKTVILLDGLDEIADENKQREVARHLSYFVTNNRYIQNRVIITSRPAEYKRDFFETQKFPHYFILPFDEPKINLFIDKWYNSRFSDSEESQRRQSSLKELLNKQERIKILVENPLLLTLVCLIHRYDAVRLPQKRDKLYETAIETLLLNWEMIRFEEKQAPIYKKLEHIKFTNLQRLMEKLAYWIHCQQIATQDKNCSTIVERDEIIEQLTKDIKNLKKIELYEAKQEAENFIDYISARSGLLNEQGKNCYAFVHKTFQEYLCAKEIDYRYQDDEGSYEEIVLYHIKEHLYNPHWREVLLLLIAIQKPKPIAKAIWAILEQDKNNEKSYYHNLLFAGSCLAEDPNNLKTADNDPSLHILRELVKLEIKPGLDETIRLEVFSTFCNLSQTEFAQLALEVLEEKEDRIDEERMQQYRNKLEKSKV